MRESDIRRGLAAERKTQQNIQQFKQQISWSGQVQNASQFLAGAGLAAKGTAITTTAVAVAPVLATGAVIVGGIIATVFVMDWICSQKD